MRPILPLCIALALAGVAPCSGSTAPSAQAPGDALAATVTTQLPRGVRPSHYAIEVAPDPGALRFEGRVRIDLEVLEATDRIVLQAVDMTFSDSALSDASGRSRAARVSVDAASQTVTFRFGRKLRPGTYVLSTRYAGKIGTQYDLSYPIRRSVFSGVGAFVHLQAFKGYGETLLEYDENKETQYRLGISLVR